MLRPNQQCDSCAFRPRGSGGAADEVHNTLKGEICALAGLPFSCHHAPDGRELNWRGTPADFIASLSGRQDMRVCAGWKRKVARLAKRGHFRNASKLCLRTIGQYGLDMLGLFIDKTSSQEDKDEAQRELGNIVRILAVKRTRK